MVNARRDQHCVWVQGVREHLALSSKVSTNSYLKSHYRTLQRVRESWPFVACRSAAPLKLFPWVCGYP